ncbi:fibronectin type III domain-containing protein [Thioalkalivibrio sulfidiphilus]|uniref:fibronectin type III domain-containing protein n=1 Tax=Thioalkalivibrio sulfidiphilus TaxID=1033854 RepID=UPI0012DF89FB|nr:fibronectin type III domain-containing protein [Thioalkalivibrio sulfidiphilus]
MDWRIPRIAALVLLASSLGGCIGDGGGESAVGTATVTLTWVAPTHRADGSAVALSDISGYRLYYGPTPDHLPHVVEIEGQDTTTYELELPVGSVYFRISAMESDGTEGMKTEALAHRL